MPRKSDRMYITQTEHSGVHGRHTAAGGGHLDRSSSSSQYQPLPYTSCAISLQQWTNPVCDKEDGTIYELTNILPWLKKYGSSPASGKPLRAADLVALHFHKNEATGVWHDPVSYKAFNDSTHLVAIATSGNVFAYDTVQQLNIKAKSWADLLTGESFTRKDLITLQDPNNVSGTKNIANLRHLKDGLTLTAADRGNKDDTDEVNLSATGSASTLLKKLKEQREGAVRAKDEAGEAALEKMKRAGESSKEATKEAAATAGPSSSKSATYTKPAQAHNAGIASTGRMGASFTSSGLTPTTINQRELISEEETMYDEICRGAGKGKAPMKGYVRLVTNFGPLNLELHCDTAPKTCYNFLTLCRRGKYNDTTFHRNIPGFMVQGGDPTGSGRGGESMWGKPFSDELSSSPGHKTRGCLSMANRGPDTNTSQFFITYAPKTHLDKKHTVFGQLVDSPSATLDALELVPTEAGTDKPLRTIRILDVQIYADPFADYQEKLHRRLHRDDDDQVAQREEKRRKREEDRTTWLGTQLGDKTAGGGTEEVALSNLTSSSTGVGKYLQSSAKTIPQGTKTAAVAPSSMPSIEPIIDASSVKKRKAGGFGDFSGW